MGQWLPDDFKPNEMAPQRVLAGVKTRIARHRRRMRTLKAGAGLCAVCFAAVVILQILHTEDLGERTSFDAASRNAIVETVPVGPPQQLAIAPEVTLSKTDHSVELAWQGQEVCEYIVYRCSSPRFDGCSVAARVKGTSWVDKEGGFGSIIFYRVAPSNEEGRSSSGDREVFGAEPRPWDAASGQERAAAVEEVKRLVGSNGETGAMYHTQGSALQWKERKT